MSRAIFEIPIIFPVSSLIDEMVKETSTSSPSFRRRTVSKCSIRSPRRSRSMMGGSSSKRSGGINIVTGCPRTSSAVYPKMRSAPLFQLMTMPSRVLPMIASSEDSTMAASRAFVPSARLRSVMSAMKALNR